MARLIIFVTMNPKQASSKAGPPDELKIFSREDLPQPVPDRGGLLSALTPLRIFY
jgi:hypothetical protein